MARRQAGRAVRLAACPQLRRHVADWPGARDFGLVAVACDASRLGPAWARLFIEARASSRERGRGIGRRLDDHRHSRRPSRRCPYRLQAAVPSAHQPKRSQACRNGAGFQQAVLPAPQLEVQVTPHGAGVSSVADVADLLAGADSVTALDERRVAQVGVPVGASVEPAADDHLVAVQDGFISGCESTLPARAAASGDASKRRRRQSPHACGRRCVALRNSRSLRDRGVAPGWGTCGRAR